MRYLFALTACASATTFIGLATASSLQATSQAPPKSASNGVSVESSVKAPRGMVYVPGGTFSMGYAQGDADEKPVHEVTLDPFFIDKHEVTNRQFKEFVEATGYVTTAERDGFAWCYLDGNDDFAMVSGANWRHPEGPGSSIDNRLDHPVVCVSWHDAQAYAEWAGRRLPTEAEWEYAARGAGGSHTSAHIASPNVDIESIASEHSGHGSHDSGKHDSNHQDAKHKDGESDQHDGAKAQHPSQQAHSGHHSGPAPHSVDGVLFVEANVWEGTWPQKNFRQDGFYYTAPAMSFQPNEAGVHDMLGNVWEWTGDWYGNDYYAESPKRNPVGPSTGTYRVARGGSWFCSPNYCGAYNSHFRGASPPANAFNNVGFRCAADVKSADIGDNAPTTTSEQPPKGAIE